MEPLPPPLPTLGPIRIAAEASTEHPAYETLLIDAPRTGWCPIRVTDPERLMHRTTLRPGSPAPTLPTSSRGAVRAPAASTAGAVTGSATRSLRRYAGDVAVMSGGRIAHHGPVAGMVAAAARSIGRPLDPARAEDVERAYLAIQAGAATCSG